MKVLIFGGSGIVGSAIARVMKEKYEVYSTFLNNKPLYGEPLKVDVRNQKEVFDTVEHIAPEVIIHCASIAEPDKCEIEKKLAF